MIHHPSFLLQTMTHLSYRQKNLLMKCFRLLMNPKQTHLLKFPHRRIVHHLQKFLHLTMLVLARLSR
jgi:hypothetical protein